MVRNIEAVVCDYGIYENGELTIICNSLRNAELIKAILDKDDMCNRGECTFDIEDYLSFSEKHPIRKGE